MADQSKNPDERVQELAAQFGRKLSDNEKKAAKALFSTFDSVREYYNLELSPVMSTEARDFLNEYASEIGKGLSGGDKIEQTLEKLKKSFSPKFEQLGDENMARIQNFVKQMTSMSKTGFEENMQ
ncbi:hypothetical protein WR25_27122 isoform B [Diploscapter pachys]|nr:hypothetical protein WR25_27122 isoform B [Diploscapter pachys]